jgi:hypothetical protein
MSGRMARGATRSSGRRRSRGRLLPPLEVRAERRSRQAGGIRPTPVNEPGCGLAATLLFAPVLGRCGDVEPVQSRPRKCAGRALLGRDGYHLPHTRHRKLRLHQQGRHVRNRRVSGIRGHCLHRKAYLPPSRAASLHPDWVTTGCEGTCPECERREPPQRWGGSADARPRCIRVHPCETRRVAESRALAVVGSSFEDTCSRESRMTPASLRPGAR